MQYMGFASFGAGECIFKQGDTGEHFYIILNGAVAVSVYTDEDNMVRVSGLIIIFACWCRQQAQPD